MFLSPLSLWKFQGFWELCCRKLGTKTKYIFFIIVQLICLLSISCNYSQKNWKSQNYTILLSWTFLFGYVWAFSNFLSLRKKCLFSTRSNINYLYYIIMFFFSYWHFQVVFTLTTIQVNLVILLLQVCFLY